LRRVEGGAVFVKKISEERKEQKKPTVGTMDLMVV
jgi:hypothetical protein